MKLAYKIALTVCTGLIGLMLARAVTDGSPREVAMSIGDKLIRTTPFEYRLVTAPGPGRFDALQVLDFARSFGDEASGMAYAYTNLVADADVELPVQIEHNGDCRIFLNGAPVYAGSNAGDARLAFEERSVQLPNRRTLPLKRGVNRLLVKLVCNRAPVFYIQPEPDNMKVGAENLPEVSIGLQSVPNVDDAIACLTPWLICGMMDAPADIDTPHRIESEVGEWGRIYPGKNGRNVTWSLPRIEILGDVIDPTPWGTPYNWNYHNGGTAWAMQQLSELTGEPRFDEYATRFCNFHLDGLPFIAYEVNDLQAFEATNHLIYKTPLLDFTLAPSLPYVYRLAGVPEPDRDPAWVAWVDEMLEYSRDQIRLPGHACYTRTTPEVYTTWVDDMFMGIPFLVYATKYTGDPVYIEDAVAQIADFNTQVWDADANLYMHARYSGRDARLPHWSRANGWGIWAVSEVLENLSPKHPQYRKLLAHYRRHVAALVKYQGPNGLWCNLLERPDSREEVSGTAIFTMAIARGIRNGWLDRKRYLPVIEKAWQGLRSRIEPDGTVYDICYGTMCSEDPEYYVNRPFYTDDTHGLFAVLMACIELDRLGVKTE